MTGLDQDILSAPGKTQERFSGKMFLECAGIRVIDKFIVKDRSGGDASSFEPFFQRPDYGFHFL
ncbi:MAG: hypothetical protein II510_02300 [Erysipelotrichales bacterium]|nr:hypothetical protein [Erysipelotrichales bacterium]